MPKSQIIKDIVEENVSLEKSLNRLFIIAKDVNNEQLSQWAENELNGYKLQDDVPEYRRKKCLYFTYSGINGMCQVTDIPLPLSWIRQEIINTISNVVILDGIRLIEIASNKNDTYRDQSILIGDVSVSTDHIVSCTSIKQSIPQSFFQHICAEVKSKMITALMELEKIYGNLDNLGIDIYNKQQSQVTASNENLNRAILNNINVNVPSQETKKERWYSKFAWNIIIPVTTAIMGALISAFLIKHFNL